MGTGKNRTGNCPYCGSDNCGSHSEQGDDRYEKRYCNVCGMSNGRNKVTFVSYPLVDPQDPHSGWIVYNPTVEATR